MNFCLPAGYDIVEVTDGLLEEIAAHMRPADAEEVWASSGTGPLQALRQSVALSDYARVTTFRGRPLTVGGLVLIDDVMGCPWQLCNAESTRHGKGLLRLGKQGLQHWLARRPFLYNLADARNAESLAWLRWLGFTFGEPISHGPQGLPFVPFWINRPGCT